MFPDITRSQAAKCVNIEDISTLEDETTTLSRKIGNELQSDTASYPRRSDSFSCWCRKLNSGTKQIMMFWKSIMYSGIFNQLPRGREEKWIRNARYIICTLNLITLWVRAAITQSVKWLLLWTGRSRNRFSTLDLGNNFCFSRERSV